MTDTPTREDDEIARLKAKVFRQRRELRRVNKAIRWYALLFRADAEVACGRVYPKCKSCGGDCKPEMLNGHA